MDRLPKGPPFAVGVSVRYVGTDRSWYEDEGDLVLILAPGMIVTVTETRPGRRGTLRPLPIEDDTETDEPVLDTTRDGASVYRVGVAGGRLIRAADAHLWEPVKMATP